jgi:hypothetical protein
MALAPHAGHHGGSGSPPPQAVRVPFALWIHGYSLELTDGEGRQLPQAFVHHVNLIAPERRELFSNIMLRLGAAGAETSPIRLPRAVGVPAGAGDSILVIAMVHNPTMDHHDGVVLRIRIPYTPASTRVRPLSVAPFYLDVMPPAGEHSFDLPPGRSERSWEGSPAIAGRILGVSGHLHRYGVALRLEDVTGGRLLWEGRPKLNAEGEVTGFPITRFVHKLGIAIQPERVYRLTAIYDNPTGGVVHDGGMGALGGVFLPARGVKWPTVVDSHPEYLLDRKIQFRLD